VAYQQCDWKNQGATQGPVKPRCTGGACDRRFFHWCGFHVVQFIRPTGIAKKFSGMMGSSIDW
jgi:hypothetical protein